MQQPQGKQHGNGLPTALAFLLLEVATAGFPWPFGGFGSPAPAPDSHKDAGPKPGAQPNPPEWPSTVRVFGPQDNPGEITAAVNQAFTTNGGHSPIDHGQFSSSRYAFLFRPGTYNVDIPVGYYTQVLGLGTMPAEVVFAGPRGVYCEEGDQTDMGGSLSTFWRGAENFHHAGAEGMLWAVSQAAPVRRVMVDKDMNLAQFVGGVGMGYASGGFLGNVQVGGTLNSASQQQWCTRNVGIGSSWQGAVWNMVFIGTQGAPGTHCGRSGDGLPQVSVPETPVISEKPFITIDASGKYTLRVPPVQRARVGPDFTPGRSVPFDKVFVAQESDSAGEINRHLAAGMDVVLSPGVYHLEAPLVLKHHNQVLLGLGLATLVPDKGTAAVRVTGVDGVHIAGVLLQAGTGDTDALLEWGDGHHKGDPDNPGFLHDVFARVGGPNDPKDYQVRAKVMVRIASGHVVGDNLWLWRADHGVAGIVKGSMNPVDHGLVVTGSHVTMYGLAAEHTLKDLVQWAGDDGETYFFQSELPYDVTPAFGDAGYVGYRVNDSVTSHKAFGVGVYHYFRDFPVVVKRGIAVPDWLEDSFEAPLSVSLTGKGTMLHVLNERGGPTHGDAGVSWMCEKGPAKAPHPVTTSPPRITTPAPTEAPPRTSRPPPTKAPPTTPQPSTTQAPTVPAVPTTTEPAAAPSPLVTIAPVNSQGPSGELEDCVQPFGKCGGKGWDGASCCVNGFLCQEMGIWYSQCLPKHVTYMSPEEVRTIHEPVATMAPPSPSSTTHNNVAGSRTTSEGGKCSQAWGKCGGSRWTGPICCTSGNTCVRQSKWLSECIPNKQVVTGSSDRVYFKKDEVVPVTDALAPRSQGLGKQMVWVLPLVLLQVVLVALVFRWGRRNSQASMPPMPTCTAFRARSLAFGLPLPLPRSSSSQQTGRFSELAASSPPALEPRALSRTAMLALATP